MVRFAPVLLEMALLVYCLIDCIQTDSSLVRNLQKPFWVILIIIVPVIGPVAWLVAGRPERSSAGGAVPWRSTQTAGFPEYERPGGLQTSRREIDERLAADQARVDLEHEEALRRWEDSLRRREDELRPKGDPPA